MDTGARSRELVEGFLDASVSPERVGELINRWDAQIAAADPSRPIKLGSAFAHQVAEILQILEQVQAAELLRVSDLLSAIHTAAMVLSDDGHVVAANRAAHLAFGLPREASIGRLALDPVEQKELVALVAEVAAAAGSREAVVRLRPRGSTGCFSSISSLSVQEMAGHRCWRPLASIPGQRSCPTSLHGSSPSRRPRSR